MSKEIEFVENQILEQFRAHIADVGHVLNVRTFEQNKMKWNPKQQDAADDALAALVSKGLIENRQNKHFLTEKGVDDLYPEVGNSIRAAILKHFTDRKSRAGEVFNTKTFELNQMVNWNPKQKQGWIPAMTGLIEDGLVEQKNDKFRLTEQGYNSIY